MTARRWKKQIRKKKSRKSFRDGNMMLKKVERKRKLKGNEDEIEQGTHWNF